MKRYFTLAVLVLLAASCGGRRGQRADGDQADSLGTAAPEAPAAPSAPKTAKADTISLANYKGRLPQEPIFDIVTSMGTIRVKLYKDTPKHRDNFTKLALSHYYDDVLFHRVIDGFMIRAATRTPAIPRGSRNGAKAVPATPSTRRSCRNTRISGDPWPPPAAATWRTR